MNVSREVGSHRSSLGHGHGRVEEWRDDWKQQVGAGQQAHMRGARKHSELGMREATHRAVCLAAAEQSKQLQRVRGANAVCIRVPLYEVSL